ncbi:MFS transporter [Catellatospora chokoriensis]|nr:MFS transporter [Catellatospora chokoriensis]
MTSTAGLGRDFRRLWAGYAISEFGSAVGAGTLPLVAIIVLDSPAWQVSMLAALSAAVAAAIAAAIALPVGSRIDLSRKRPYMIGADLVRFAALASLPAAAALGALTITQLCLVGVVNTAAAMTFAAASGAHLKNLVPAQLRTRANSRMEATFWTAISVGPPLGGLIVSAVGPLATAAVDAVSYLGSAAWIRRIRTPEPPPAARHDEPWTAQLTAGWRYIYARADLGALFVNSQIFGGAIMLASPILPVLMLGELGLAPWQYGLAVGVPALGGIVGSLLTGPLVRRYGSRRVLLGAGAARTVWMVLVPFAPPDTAGLVLIIVADTMLLLCAGVFGPLFVTYRMDAVGDGHLGRVLTTWSAGTRCVQPLFIAAGGVLAWLLGPAAAIGVAALLLLASSVLLPWNAVEPDRPARALRTAD